MAAGDDDGNTLFDVMEDGPVLPPAPPDDEGRYDVGPEFARGGLGRLHTAKDLRLHRVVAYKTLLRPSVRATQRFERETRLTARLQHPNIVPVHDGGMGEDGQPFLTMRLVHGRALDEAIAEPGSLQGRLKLLPHVVDACNAVAYAHTQRVVHRDLKPDNILVGDFGETVVIDWGLAKDLDDEDPLPTDDTTSGTSGSLTQIGTVVGTPAYMPPEQASGHEVDARADVYALGAVLYEVLAGSAPYAEARDVLAAVRAGPPIPLASAVDGVPLDLLAVVDKAMARRPADRYPDAAHLAAELERFTAGRLVGAYRYSPIERLRHQVRRYPAAAGLGVVLAIATVAFVIGLLRATHIAEEARATAEDLRRDETRRADALAIGQARASLDRDPRETLRLLASLSADRPADAVVRTLATEAWAAAPPPPLATDPAIGTPFDVAFADRIVAVGPGGVELFAPGGGPSTVHRIEGIRNLLAHQGAPWFAVVTDREVLVFEHGGLKATHRLDANPTWAGVYNGGILLRLDPDQLGHVTPDGALALRPAPEGMRFVVSQGDDRLIVARDKDVRTLSARGDVVAEVPWPGAVWAMATGIDDAVAVGETTRVLRMTWDPGAPPQWFDTTHAWMDLATYADADHVVVGGDGPFVTIIELSTQKLRTVPLSAPPDTLVSLKDGWVAVGTTTGELGWLHAASGAHTRFEATGRASRRLAIAPGVGDDGPRLLALDNRGIRVAEPRRRDGQVLGGVRGIYMQPVGEGLVALDRGRLVRWSGHGEQEVLQESDQSRVPVRPCGGRAWWTQGGALHSVGATGSPRHTELHLSARPAQLYDQSDCSADGHTLYLGTGDTLHRIDTASGVVLQRHRFPAEPLRSVTRRPRSEELVVTAGDTAWRVAGGDLSSTTTLHHEPLQQLLHTTWGDDGLVIVRSDGWVLTGDPLVPRVRINESMIGVTKTGPLVLSEADGDTHVLQADGTFRTFGVHRSWPETVVNDPSGAWLATAGWGGVAWLWDRAHPDLPRRQLRGTGIVRSFVWTDGPIPQLFTSDLSGDVRVWHDPLARDPDVLRAQIHEMVRRLDAGQQVPTAAELQAWSPTP